MKRTVPCVLALGGLILLSRVAVAADVESLLARSDAAYAERAEGHEGVRARPGPIGRAISDAEAALAADSASLAARWRLLRALYFQGEYVAPDADAKRAVCDRAAKLAEESTALLGRRLGAEQGLAGMLQPVRGTAEAPSERAAMRAALARAGIDAGEAARLHFWAAIAWGSWSQGHGLVGAVRKGVAQRMYENARVVAALDPALEAGGGFRLLARLHAKLPKFPLLSGWVDRDLAVPYAEHAMAIAPAFPGNRLMLGMTLLTLAPSRRGEAIDLLRQVADLEPAPAHIVEELAMQQAARARLAAQPGIPLPGHPVERRTSGPPSH